MKIYLSQILIVFAILLSTNLNAQTPILAIHSQTDSVWIIDTATATQIYPGTALTSSTGTIEGCTGLSVRPCTGEIYVAYKVTSSGTTRYLGILDPSSGIITEVGNMGDNVAGISFGSEDHLYAVTGDGASTPETLFKVNISTGAMTLFVTLGNGNDGENICFNPDDGKIYHWSGLGTQVMESIDTLTGAVTNITQSGVAHDEVKGSAYVGNGIFIVSDHSDNIVAIGINGIGLANLATLDYDFKGLVFPLSWVSTTASGFCPGDSVTLTNDVAATSYQWYDDGTILTGEVNQTLTVFAAGDYHCAAINGVCSAMSDTMSISIFNLPIVDITPGLNASYCTNDSVLLTGTSGGSSQWFVDGVAISGATNDTYYASMTGLYNMIKTNNNGCADSSATGTLVTENALPIVDITPSSSTNICPGDSAELVGSTGITYQWMLNGTQILGATTNSYFAQTAGVYNVLVEDANGCIDSSSSGTMVNLFNLPVVTLSPSTDTMICVGDSVEITSSSAANYQWLIDGNQIAGATSISYSANTPGHYNVVVEDANGCADSASTGISVLHDSTCFVSVADVFANDLSFYPNPVTDVLSFSVTSINNQPIIVSLYSIEGKILMSGQFSNTGGSINSIDLSSIIDGVYLMEMRQGENRKVIRIVKSN